MDQAIYKTIHEGKPYIEDKSYRGFPFNSHSFGYPLPNYSPKRMIGNIAVALDSVADRTIIFQRDSESILNGVYIKDLEVALNHVIPLLGEMNFWERLWYKEKGSKVSVFQQDSADDTLDAFVGISSRRISRSNAWYDYSIEIGYKGKNVSLCSKNVLDSAIDSLGNLANSIIVECISAYEKEEAAYARKIMRRGRPETYMGMPLEMLYGREIEDEYNTSATKFWKERDPKLIELYGLTKEQKEMKREANSKDLSGPDFIMNENGEYVNRRDHLRRIRCQQVLIKR